MTITDDASHNDGSSTFGGQTNLRGYKIKALTNCTLIRVTKHSSCTAPTCYLKDTSNNTLATASFSGDNATFSYSLTSGTYYWLLCGGGSYTIACKGSPSFPYSGTNIEYTKEVNGTTEATSWDMNVTSIRTETIDNVTVSATALTLSTTAEEPTIITTIQGGALSLNLGLYDPTLDGLDEWSSHVVVGTGTIGTRFINKRYPVTKGLIAGTTRQ